MKGLFLYFSVKIILAVSTEEDIGKPEGPPHHIYLRVIIEKEKDRHYSRMLCVCNFIFQYYVGTYIRKYWKYLISCFLREMSLLLKLI